MTLRLGGPQKKGRGRPEHEPTDELRKKVAQYSAGALPHHYISILVGISTKTLLKHYSQELQLGKAGALALTTGVLLKAIKNDEAWAVCFFLKCQGGWSEKSTLEMTGKDGKPLIPQQRFKISFEEGGPGEDASCVITSPKKSNGDEGGGTAS
jgi:hypothetical protein